MQVREKVGKSRNAVFFRYFVTLEGRKVGSQGLGATLRKDLQELNDKVKEQQYSYDNLHVQV